MKFKIIFTFFIIFSFSLYPSWKKEIFKYFSGNIIDYDNAITCLSKSLQNAEPSEVPQMTLILAYAFAKVNNFESEFIQIKNLIENHYDQFSIPDFLPDHINIDVTNYYNSWLQKYPLIYDFSLDKNTHFWDEKPEDLTIRFKAINITSYKLFKGEEVLQTSFLFKGENALTIKNIDISKIHPINDHFIEVSLGLIKIRKNIIINTAIDIPDNVIISDGQLSFKDRSFKNETIEEKLLVKKTSLDKKYFYRRCLPYLVTGATFFTVDTLLINKKLKDRPYSASSDPFLYSSHQAFKTFSISVSLFSVYHFFKSFKTTYSEEIKVHMDVNAANYNNFLRESIRQMQKKIKIILSIEARPE